MQLFKKLITFLCVFFGIVAFFWLFFYFLVSSGITVDKANVSTYQFIDLKILYISSCVTTLALIVALLKDEIRALWRSPKILIKSKYTDFLIEKIDPIPIGQSDIRAEYHQVILSIINNGSLHVNSCSISLIDLEYFNVSGHKSSIDVSLAEDIKWLGKNQSTTPIHSNAGKAEASVLKININDASTADAGSSQSAKLFIGGIDATHGHKISQGSRWVATFMIYFDTYKPIKYKLEISWDGVWHNRLKEMLDQSIKIKEIKK